MAANQMGYITVAIAESEIELNQMGHILPTSLGTRPGAKGNGLHNRCHVVVGKREGIKRAR